MKKILKKIINSIGYDVHKVNKESNDEYELYRVSYCRESILNKRFYNIGAGRFSHPYWTNVDHESDWYCNNCGSVSYDLLSLDPLPIEDNTAEIIYSSHTIEHITDQAAQNMFNESYRALKKGGTFRIVTPNIDLAYRAYKNNDRSYFYWIEEYSILKNYSRVKYNKPLNESSIEQIFLAHFATSVSTLHCDGAKEGISDQELNRLFMEKDYESALNYCTSKCPIDIQKKYPGNHINWWNKVKAFDMLEKAGFQEIYLSGYGQSFSPVLRNTSYFDNTRPKITLFVEAIK
jgi:predicted SAM-dependent methyltransferase